MMFNWSQFTSHSGLSLNWKVDCDSFTSEDWVCLATIARQLLQADYREIIGIYRGGIPFADALYERTTTWSHRVNYPVLIVDDVFTTGRSMEEERLKWKEPVKGLVVFARNPTPAWITPIWTLNAAIKNSQSRPAAW